MTESTSPDMRIQISITGNRALRIRKIMKMNGFRSENEAVQYLVNRAIEASAPTVRQWEMMQEIQNQTLASQAEMFSSMATMIEHEETTK